MKKTLLIIGIVYAYCVIVDAIMLALYKAKKLPPVMMASFDRMIGR